MNILQQLSQKSQEFWESILRIFRPSDDDYPETGVQPYEGDSYEEQ